MCWRRLWAQTPGLVWGSTHRSHQWCPGCAGGSAQALLAQGFCGSHGATWSGGTPGYKGFGSAVSPSTPLQSPLKPPQALPGQKESPSSAKALATEETLKMPFVPLLGDGFGDFLVG